MISTYSGLTKAEFNLFIAYTLRIKRIFSVITSNSVFKAIQILLLTSQRPRKFQKIIRKRRFPSRIRVRLGYLAHEGSPNLHEVRSDRAEGQGVSLRPAALRNARRSEVRKWCCRFNTRYTCFEVRN